MQRHYEIPEPTEQLSLGHWVEIFEAYGEAEGNGAIRVKSMRVAGKLLVFGKRNGRRNQLLRPHEGQIVSIDRQPRSTRFALRLGV